MTFVRKSAAFGAIVLATAAASAASAAPVPVTNASFEQPGFDPGTYQTSGDIPGWTQIGTAQGAAVAGVQNFGDNNYFQPADGSQVVYINRGTLSQDLGPLLANMIYTLTVAAGNQPNYGRGSTGAFGFYSSNNDELSSAVAVPLTVGSTTDFSTSFTSGSTVAGNLFIRLSNRSGDQVLFDNVRVTAASTIAAVPETATWAMMIAGFGVVGVALRRRQKVTSRVSYAA